MPSLNEVLGIMRLLYVIQVSKTYGAISIVKKNITEKK